MFSMSSCQAVSSSAARVTVRTQRLTGAVTHLQIQAQTSATAQQREGLYSFLTG